MADDKDQKSDHKKVADALGVGNSKTIKLYEEIKGRANALGISLEVQDHGFVLEHGGGKWDAIRLQSIAEIKAFIQGYERAKKALGAVPVAPPVEQSGGSH